MPEMSRDELAAVLSDALKENGIRKKVGTQRGGDVTPRPKKKSSPYCLPSFIADPRLGPTSQTGVIWDADIGIFNNEKSLPSRRLHRQ
jgi:hypothetical protein